MSRGITLADVLAVFVGATIVGCAELGTVRSAVGLTRDLGRLVREADELARVKRPTAAQRQREAELNAIFERDMREADGLDPEWPGHQVPGYGTVRRPE